MIENEKTLRYIRFFSIRKKQICIYVCIL